MIDILKNLNGKTVAVTGASGYIGSALSEALQNQLAQVVRISRSELTPNPGMIDVQADVCTQSCWQDIVSRVDIVFHLAGNTSIYTALNDPVESLNSTLLPINHLIAAAQKSGRVPRVVFASTATVYGLTDGLPVSETRESKPITLYDLHKCFAEKQLALAGHLGVLQSISLRLANVYGPSLNASSAADRGVLNKISKMALQNKDLLLFGDGDYVRDYVYIDDVVNAFMCAGASDQFSGQIFNVASGHGVTLKEAFHEVVCQSEKITGRKIAIHNAPWPEGADAIEYRNFIGDVQALKDAFNWQPQTSLVSGIGSMLDVFSKA